MPRQGLFTYENGVLLLLGFAFGIAFTIAGAAMIIGGCLLAARTPQEADPSLEVAA